MLEKKFLLGSINQGKVDIGDEFSAHKQNTIFFSGICAAENYLDDIYSDQSPIAVLKKIGGLSLVITNITPVDSEYKVAELEMTKHSLNKYNQTVEYLFPAKNRVYVPQNPSIMSLTTTTNLKINDTLTFGYLSILKPLGEGRYRLMHDYPLDRTQGPRFEINHE